MIGFPSTPSPQPTPTQPSDWERSRLEITKRIRKLQAKSNRGFFYIALFLVVSIGAARDFSMLPSLPEEIRGLMGRPPSANMISALLILYSFSAIVLILARMMGGSDSYGGISHVGYLTVFFGFYHFSGSMEGNYWAVFAAGMTILGLEAYHIWTRCMEEIRKVQELLTQMDRKFKSRE